MQRFFSHITIVFLSLVFLWQSSLVIAAFEPPKASFPEGGPAPQSAGALLDVLTAGEDASSFTDAAKIGGAVQVTGLKVSDTNVRGMILTASTTAGIATWSSLPSSLPSQASINQTLRYNGSEWVSSSFFSNTASRVGIGIEGPATTLEVNDSGRAQVATLRIIDLDTGQNPEFQLQYGSNFTSDHFALYVKKKDGIRVENSFRVWGGGDDRLALGPKGVVVFGTPSAMRLSIDSASLEVGGSVRIAGQGVEPSAFVVDTVKRSIAANIGSDVRYAMNVGGTLEASKGFCLGAICYPSWDMLNKWKKSSEGIYYDAGSVGAGADPHIMLDIVNLAGDSQKDTSLLRMATGIVKLKTGLRFDRLGREQWFAGMNEREDLFRIQRIGKQIDDFAIDSSGQVGVGTVPTSRFAVRGQPEFVVGSGGISYDQNQKTVINGTSTLFKTELKNGYFILVGSEKRIITAIDSDTRMTIDKEFPEQVISTSTDFAITYSFSPQGTGKIYRDTSSESQIVIKGKDTVFQQELKSGFTLFANNEVRFIVAVDSDTSLRIDRPFSDSFPTTNTTAVAFSWRTPVAQFFSSTDAALAIDNDGRVGIGTFFPQADLSLQSSPNMQTRGLSIEVPSFGANNARRFQSTFVRMRSTSTGENYTLPFTIRGSGHAGIGEFPDDSIRLVVGPQAAANGMVGEVQRLSIMSYSGVQDPWVFKTSDDLENSTLQLWGAGKPAIAIQSNGNIAFGDVKTSKKASVKGNTTVDGTTFVNELKLLGDITAKNFIIQQNGKKASVVSTPAVGSANEPCETTCANNRKKCIYGTDDSNKEVDSYMRCDETRSTSNVSCLCAEFPDIVPRPKILEFCAVPPASNMSHYINRCDKNVTVVYPNSIFFKWETLYGDEKVSMNEIDYGRTKLPRSTKNLSLYKQICTPQYGSSGFYCYNIPCVYSCSGEKSDTTKTYVLTVENSKGEQATDTVTVTQQYPYPEIDWWNAFRMTEAKEFWDDMDFKLEFFMKNGSMVDWSPRNSKDSLTWLYESNGWNRYQLHLYKNPGGGEAARKAGLYWTFFLEGYGAVINGLPRGMKTEYEYLLRFETNERNGPYDINEGEYDSCDGNVEYGWFCDGKTTDTRNMKENNGVWVGHCTDIWSYKDWGGTKRYKKERVTCIPPYNGMTSQKKYTY